ncbi:MAG TPA: hypothetical protein VLF18_22685 [Tahibacter sp.]|uniref:hypothetical protein n=1 Tax=Tahibacter sp. TaxID=2056211 RepID=UPI002BBF0947|nr:hypothetical protein [Tahibacter sp.]HSX63003.1 hypothetical protein [Tahibacter sp.]
MPASTVRFAVLAGIVAAQTLLIGLYAPRTLRALERVAWLVDEADGVVGWLRYGMGAAIVLVLGLLPLLFALGLGVAAAWSLRVYSSTPQHVEGLGAPIVGLVLGQCLLLGLWLWLLPGATPGDAWQNDGYGYTLLVVLTSLLWAFCNAMLLWRGAGGPAPQRDPHELRRLRELGLRRARELAADDEPPP